VTMEPILFTQQPHVSIAPFILSALEWIKFKSTLDTGALPRTQLISIAASLITGACKKTSHFSIEVDSFLRMIPQILSAD